MPASATILEGNLADQGGVEPTTGSQNDRPGPAEPGLQHQTQPGLAHRKQPLRPRGEVD